MCLCVRSGVIDDMEYACYCQWFDYVLKRNSPQLDLIGECEWVGSHRAQRQPARSPAWRRLSFIEALLFFQCIPHWHNNCSVTWLTFLLCSSSSLLSPVYLRSSPEVCYRRLLQRGRREEKPVTLVSPVAA